MIRMLAISTYIKHIRDLSRYNKTRKRKIRIEKIKLPLSKQLLLVISKIQK